MIYLASQSPRRRELLDQIGVQYQCIPADIDESPLCGEKPQDYVQRMAISKAEAIHQQHRNHPVLGSDTCVVLNNHILGKPENRQDAIEMLMQLSGHSHQVLTSVALVHRQTHYRLSSSEVLFRKIKRDEAERYWLTGEPVDKAGGYAIQGYAAVFVASIQGSYSGIMGLPLYETAQLLELIEESVWTEV